MTTTTTVRDQLLEVRQAATLLEAQLADLARNHPESNRPHAQRAAAALVQAQRELLEAWFAEPVPAPCAYCGRDVGDARVAPIAHGDMGALCPSCYASWTPVGCTCATCAL